MSLACFEPFAERHDTRPSDIQYNGTQFNALGQVTLRISSLGLTKLSPMTPSMKIISTITLNIITLSTITLSTTSLCITTQNITVLSVALYHYADCRSALQGGAFWLRVILWAKYFLKANRKYCVFAFYQALQNEVFKLKFYFSMFARNTFSVYF